MGGWIGFVIIVTLYVIYIMLELKDRRINKAREIVAKENKETRDNFEKKMEKRKNYFKGWNLVINFFIAIIPAAMVSTILREIVTSISRGYYQRLVNEGVNPKEAASRIAVQGGLLNSVITVIVIIGFIYLVGTIRIKISEERENKKDI